MHYAGRVSILYRPDYRARRVFTKHWLRTAWASNQRLTRHRDGPRREGFTSAIISPSLPPTLNVRHLPHYFPMSSASNTTPTSSNFDVIFNTALTEYTKRTGKDLCNHPLVSKIDSCHNPESILDIFQEQAETFDKFKKGDTKLFKWLRPVVNVLHAISTNKTFSDKASHVSPPIFVLLLLDNLPLRCFRLQRRSYPLSISCYLCVSLLLSPPHFFFTPRTARRPRM